MRTFRQTFLLFYLFLFAGCVFSPKLVFHHSYPPDQRPEFWIEYHAYPPEQFDSLTPKVRAIPHFDGWTDLRMERDIQRISAAGFTTILLHITPENMASDIFMERLSRFHQLASKMAEPPTIALVVSPQAKVFTLSLSNTMRFFSNRGMGKLPCALLIEKRPILFFSENVNLIDEHYGLEKHAKINEFFPPVEAYHSSCGKPGCRVSATARLFADATTKPANQIATYRDNGLFLAKQLQRAFEQQVPIIYVSSWNNYQNANFIEDNSLDQRKMLEVLQKAQSTLANKTP